jgi:hypothetical protein
MDLERIASQLRSMFGGSITIERARDTLLISFAAHAAEVGVTIADPAGPSFDVTYPAIRGEASGIHDAREHAAAGVLFEGLAWIIREIVEHGAVLPEFHHLRRKSGPRT